ncbi:hypothetical protein [Paenibacillus naphthalenovorans]|uniref:Uncharacterized protein n=1 Tax=Paenibacillus naphthalenovorans TaxID=162209 RepID=A0A0U2W729_9BACL|nr:hypothetical protein [Paenibacillus naphthalenovorans]ALS22254.1 hypothetical protein IJ22_18800 [Paenibacillus naphthalenovorans]
MDNSVLINRIQKYQDNTKEGVRCGHYYTHGKVVPIIQKGEVILKCQRCSWSSRFIAPIFYRDDFEEVYNN